MKKKAARFKPRVVEGIEIGCCVTYFPPDQPYNDIFFFGMASSEATATEVAMTKAWLSGESTEANGEVRVHWGTRAWCSAWLSGDASPVSDPFVSVRPRGQPVIVVNCLPEEKERLDALIEQHRLAEKVGAANAPSKPAKRV